MPLLHRARCGLLAALLAIAVLPAVARKPVLRAPVMVNGRPFRLTDGVPKAMCRAVVSEMHTEVLKHNLRKDGEDEIFETAGMAICLGVVQNYTFDERKSGKWAMRAKTATEKEAEEEGGLESVRFEAMMLMKEACFSFCDELQQEISEMTYRGVGKGRSPDEIADSFCVPDVLSPAPKKKKKVTKAEAKKRQKKAADDADAFGGPQGGDMQGQYEKFLAQMNKDGSVGELLRTDRDHPHLLLPEEHQQDIKEGTNHVACAACRTAVRQVRAAADANERTARDEAKLGEIARRAFIGEQEEESDSMDYVPGNPPKWVLGYTVSKGKDGRWEMRRSQTEEQEEGEEGGDPYTTKVKRNTMIAHATRKAWQMAEDADADIAELIVRHPKWGAKKLAEAFCTKQCRSGGGGGSDEL